jgi:hypothetical protein
MVSGEQNSGPSTRIFRCARCEDRGKSPVAFEIVTEPGAVSEHWCGMRVRWTGVGKYGMQVLHDPGDAPAAVALGLLALPTIVALLVGGGAMAALVAIGTVVFLLVWRLVLLPGVWFLSDIVDAVRGVPPEGQASRTGKWW